MLCPYCGTAAQISRTRTTVRGDSSPDTRTEVRTVQEFVCRDSHCDHCGKVVARVEHRVY